MKCVCAVRIMLNIHGSTLNDEENIELTPYVHSMSLGLRFSSLDFSSSIKLLIYLIVIVRIQMEILMEVRDPPLSISRSLILSSYC